MNSKSILLGLLGLLAFARFSAASDTSVIAKVGESEVKADDIKPLLEKLPLRDQLQLAHDPAALNDFVRRLIIQQLVFKEALSKKWEQQPQVAAQLEQLRQQAITQSYLQSLATPPPDYPSQAELQKSYEALKKSNALLVPKQYHLAQIYVACPEGSDKAAVEKAQAKLDAVQKALKGGGDFAAVAKAQSDEAQAAQHGGDLGWLPENQIQPEIRNAIAPLSKGALTEAVRTKDGWHIIRLVETKDPYTASLDEVKAAIANELRRQRAQVLAKSYLGKLLQQNPVTLNEIAVSKLIDIKGN
jgi:parvulin-like peptidyl-prolyl isomerase